MFRSKKAMSPLIATILLIAFAVSIGAVIMSYGNAYQNNNPLPEENICDSVKMEFYEIDGNQQICHKKEGNLDHLSFILINKGKVDIDQVQLITSFSGETNSVKVMELRDSSMSPGIPVEHKLPIDTSAGDLVQLQFIAEVITGTEKNQCFLDPISMSSIRDC